MFASRFTSQSLGICRRLCLSEHMGTIRPIHSVIKAYSQITTKTTFHHSTANLRSLSSVSLFTSHQQRSFSTQEKPSANNNSSQTTTWIDRYMPSPTRPYLKLARLDKPIGTWLLLWPCLWSTAIATPIGQMPDFYLMGLFSIGAVVMRGAGCVINDLWDKDIDKQVERTAMRPLASGELSRKQAVAFLASQLSIGLAVLTQLNLYTIILGASSLGLVVVYPAMKRITHWPQAVLGLTFNWGALVGWAAVHGSLDLATVLPMYLAGVAWTIHYDTIYAHQDKVDDVKVGVRSTALLFADKTKSWVSGFSAVAIAGLALSGFEASLAWPYYASLAAAASHLAWQIQSVDLNNRQDCMAKFVSNRDFGAIVFAGILAAKSGLF
eukprot:TRINITY_DN9884_c0_g1_i1.p1 TRINITY_DN9884_c0_g1~~TRINITY_DN9884_c0_g1_i1.p1  ORF type:complete len:381 (+),score=75.34 TRINITY_DN9884_c0_g1_i1:75-1217(+)